jgi:MFS family permease
MKRAFFPNATREIWNSEPTVVQSPETSSMLAAAPRAAAESPNAVRFGLRANVAQFALLMLVNAFVGGMVGLERTVVPLIGTQEFGLVLNTVAVSFIISFGVIKALANLVSGTLADRFGRKSILIAGWLIGLPVPFLIMWAPSWSWIVAANVLLGINQGFAWSMAVVMKIDLVGPRQKGLAVGLNEFAGYLAVGITALFTGLLASKYGLRPHPFYIGGFYAVAGLLLSIFAVRDTRGHLHAETMLRKGKTETRSFGSVFAQTTWGNRTTFSVCQAGLINNLNDGMSWGILPLFFAARSLPVDLIGVLKFVYPAVWAIAQLVTGPLSDTIGRKPLIVWGMTLQAAGIWLTVMSGTFAWWIGGAVLLGIGTAMVYPALIAVVSDVAEPAWRARSLSVYRFWRDLGYAIGALLAGIIADLLGFAWAIGVVGALTLFSGIEVAFGMQETVRTGVQVRK